MCDKKCDKKCDRIGNVRDGCDAMRGCEQVYPPPVGCVEMAGAVVEDQIRALEGAQANQLAEGDGDGTEIWRRGGRKDGWVG